MPSIPSPESLDAYRALVESADDIILIADWKTARFVDANRVALERLGYTMEELSQMTGGDLSQLPREEHRRFSKELIEDGETTVRAVPIRCRNGALVHMDLWVRRFDVDGASYHLNVLREARPSEDDPRFRIARDRLLTSEAFYRGVVTCTEDSVIVCDLASQSVIEANPAACALFGYSTVEWGERTISDLYPEGPLRDRLCALIGGDGSARLPEVELTRSDGSRFYADARLNVFESGGETLLVTIVRDVTAQKEQRERWERAQRLAAIGEVAAGVAHEINNPAAFVLMNCDTIEAQIDQLEAHLQRLRSAADGELAEAAPDPSAMRAAVRDNREGVERIRSVARDLREAVRRQYEDAVGLGEGRGGEGYRRSVMDTLGIDPAAVPAKNP